MNTILSEGEMPKLPDPDLHDGVTLSRTGKYNGTTDGYSAEAMKAYADAREAAVLEKLAAHPPLGYVHPHAVERLKTGETVPFRKQPYKGERQIPVYATPRPEMTQVPTLDQIMAVAKAIHRTAPYAAFPEWDELRQHEIDALRTRAEKVISAMLTSGLKVPPGYKLVPAQPSSEFIKRVENSGVWGENEVRNLYADIIAAAATQETSAEPPGVPAGDEERDAEHELNCAEEVLDSVAAQLDLEVTGFDCVGDYITAVCSALQAKADKTQDALRQAVHNFSNKERGVPQAHIAAQLVAELDEAFFQQLNGCKIDSFSSRTCERGTNSCTVRHNAVQEALDNAVFYRIESLLLPPEAQADMLRDGMRIIENLLDDQT